MVKNIFIGIGFILGFIFLIFVFYQASTQTEKTLSYVLEGTEVRLLIADTPKEWEEGLMGREKLPDDVDGMIFIFPDKKVRRFWNKNTYLDLDIYWVVSDRTIEKSFLPSIKKSKEIVTVESPSAIDAAVEIEKK